MNDLKENFGWVMLVLIVVGVFSYNHWYIPYRNLQNGFVIVNGFDCPSEHPIKAHLGSMIYHVAGDPYYARTNASNGECFDTTDHAMKQGFRASRGTPMADATAPSTAVVYKGGYAPNGAFCDYGYNPDTKNCCGDDDYTCEVRDLAPKGATALCIDGTYSLDSNSTQACIGHGGVQTDPQFTPYQ